MRYLDVLGGSKNGVRSINPHVTGPWLVWYAFFPIVKGQTYLWSLKISMLKEHVSFIKYPKSDRKNLCLDGFYIFSSPKIS